MGDNMTEDVMMDLDLNQEPSESSTGSVIRFRIQQLEEVPARNRQLRRRREGQNSDETSCIQVVPRGEVDHEIGDCSEQGSTSTRRNASEKGKGKSCKRVSFCSVGKALEMDLDKKRPSSSDSGGNFYDCIICLDMAKEPILTCCGHLFCWACFYKLPYVYLTSKECPICKGEVTDTSIIPIYGNGNDTHPVNELDSDSKIPPRPKAHRLENVLQRRVNIGASNVSFMEAIQDITSRIAAMEEILRQRNLNAVSVGEGEPETQIMDSLAEINYLSSRRLDDLATVVSMENVARETAVETETNAQEIRPVAPARRRTRVSRVTDVDNGLLRRPRRRRLDRIDEED